MRPRDAASSRENTHGGDRAFSILSLETTEPLAAHADAHVHGNVHGVEISRLEVIPERVIGRLVEILFVHAHAEKAPRLVLVIEVELEGVCEDLEGALVLVAVVVAYSNVERGIGIRGVLLEQPHLEGFRGLDGLAAHHERVGEAHVHLVRGDALAHAVRVVVEDVLEGLESLRHAVGVRRSGGAARRRGGGREGVRVGIEAGLGSGARAVRGRGGG